MKYLYDVLDTDTGEYVVESGTSALKSAGSPCM